MARNYRAEYDRYQGKPEQIANRAKRNAARSDMMKKGVVSKGDGKDVDHKTALSKGGKTIRSNLRAVPASQTRSYKRKSDGSMK